MRKNLIILSLVLFGLGYGCEQNNQKEMEKNMSEANINKENLEKATFAGGCFWCMEPPYDNLDGVVSVLVGYTGGSVQNPTYEEVSTGTTGHLEAVQITFDSSKISYANLLKVFWRNIDPTDPYGQFADKGSQYETAIFYHDDRQKELALGSKKELAASGKFSDPIMTKIRPAEQFYPAEEYHQDFYKNHPLRYKNYKVGSGRAGFLEETWGDQK
jgi:peptide methionine sulfoxide reductase msrA/msrB